MRLIASSHVTFFRLDGNYDRISGNYSGKPNLYLNKTKRSLTLKHALKTVCLCSWIFGQMKRAFVTFSVFVPDICVAVFVAARWELHANWKIQTPRPRRPLLDRRRWAESLPHQFAVLHILIRCGARLVISSTAVDRQQWSLAALPEQLLCSVAQQFSGAGTLESCFPLLQFGHFRAAAFRLPLQRILGLLRAQKGSRSQTLRDVRCVRLAHFRRHWSDLCDVSSSLPWKKQLPVDAEWVLRSLFATNLS